jgi:hypothetical protein
MRLDTLRAKKGAKKRGFVFAVAVVALEHARRLAGDHAAGFGVVEGDGNIINGLGKTAEPVDSFPRSQGAGSP